MNTPLFTLLLIAVSTTLNAAEVFDAPGPGYREQAARKASPTDTSHVFRHTQVGELRFSPVLKSPRSATPEVAPMPKTNPFEKPIQLFAPGGKP